MLWEDLLEERQRILEERDEKSHTFFFRVYMKSTWAGDCPMPVHSTSDKTLFLMVSK